VIKYFLIINLVYFPTTGFQTLTPLNTSYNIFYNQQQQQQQQQRAQSNF
jgi:hypothetical protein